MENVLANAVCKRFEEEGVVCLTDLRKGLFTVGALDNIDHNPSSTISQDSFHGTGMNIFQFTTASEKGICRDLVVIQSNCEQEYHELPCVEHRSHEHRSCNHLLRVHNLALTGCCLYTQQIALNKSVIIINVHACIEC